MKKYFSIGEFAEMIGQSIQTLRNWDKEGTLKPSYRTEGGHRMYSLSQLDNLIGKSDKDKRVIGYCRATDTKSLKTQNQKLESYMLGKGYTFEILKDIGEGISLDRSKLIEVFRLILTNKVSKLVILYKSVLSEDSFSFLESICIKFRVDIEIINKTNSDNLHLYEKDVELFYKKALKKLRGL